MEISEKKLVEGTFETAIRYVNSLETCRVSGSRVLVSVGGGSPSYLESCSNVLELKSKVQDTKTQVKKKNQPESNQTQNLTQKESQTQMHPDAMTRPKVSIRLPPNDNPNPSSNYSEKVLADFMSQVLVYVQTLFKDFAQKYQAKYVAERGKGKVSH